MATGTVIHFGSNQKIAFVKDDHSGNKVLIINIDHLSIGTRVYYTLLSTQSGLVGIRIKIIK